MSLIDTTYFKSDITLPDGVNSNGANDIKTYEPYILDKLFGYELSKEIQAYDKDSSTQRIKDIVEGKEYTVSHNGRDQTIKWNGLQNTEKISLIAYYSYFEIQGNNATQTANVGEIIPEQQHSNPAAVKQKQASAWLKLQNLYGYIGQSTLKPSAYNFMTNFISEYPEWIFDDVGEPGDVNEMGI